MFKLLYLSIFFEPWGLRAPRSHYMVNELLVRLCRLVYPSFCGRGDETWTLFFSNIIEDEITYRNDTRNESSDNRNYCLCTMLYVVCVCVHACSFLAVCLFVDLVTFISMQLQTHSSSTTAGAKEVEECRRSFIISEEELLHQYSKVSTTSRTN